MAGGGFNLITQSKVSLSVSGGGVVLLHWRKRGCAPLGLELPERVSKEKRGESGGGGVAGAGTSVPPVCRGCRWE